MHPSGGFSSLYSIFLQCTQRRCGRWVGQPGPGFGLLREWTLLCRGRRPQGAACLLHRHGALDVAQLQVSRRCGPPSGLVIVLLSRRQSRLLCMYISVGLLHCEWVVCVRRRVLLRVVILCAWAHGRCCVSVDGLVPGDVLLCGYGPVRCESLLCDLTNGHCELLLCVHGPALCESSLCVHIIVRCESLCVLRHGRCELLLWIHGLARCESLHYVRRHGHCEPLMHVHGLVVIMFRRYYVPREVFVASRYCVRGHGRCESLLCVRRHGRCESLLRVRGHGRCESLLCVR